MQNSFSSAKLRKISQNALFYQKLIFKTHYFTSFHTSKRTICTRFLFPHPSSVIPSLSRDLSTPVEMTRKKRPAHLRKQTFTVMISTTTAHISAQPTTNREQWRRFSSTARRGSQSSLSDIAEVRRRKTEGQPTPSRVSVSCSHEPREQREQCQIHLSIAESRPRKAIANTTEVRTDGAARGEPKLAWAFPKAAIEREKRDACISISEREQGQRS